MAVLTEPVAAFGNYNIICKIAEGGYGAVYKARHWQTGELVAVKVLAPRLVRDPLIRKRFQQEFRAASRIDHPHIVRCLDGGLEGPAPFLVMEYVDGPNLAQRIAQRGRLPEAEAVHIIGQISEALHVAHQQKIIHRDVKPANILLTSGGQAKLTDLGLVKDIEADQHLTRTGWGLGTPHYIAPEQFRNARAADVRCDIYALGATLYTAVTGQVPFHAETPLAVLQLKLKNRLPAARDLAPQLSERVEQAMLRALSTDPEQRPTSCLEFLFDLTDDPVIWDRLEAELAVRVAVVGLAAGPSRSKDRRRRTRQTCDLPGTFQPIGGDPEFRWKGIIRDISTDGLGLLLGRRFEPGTFLALELCAGPAQPPRRLLARVAWVKALSPRKWHLGCAFAYRLGEDDVLALVRGVSAGPQPGR